MCEGVDASSGIIAQHRLLFAAAPVEIEIPGSASISHAACVNDRRQPAKMQFRHIILLALAAGLYTVSADGVTCQTTTGSPFTNDTTDVINQLKGLGTSAWCEQHNDYGSYCTTMVSHNTAALSICGVWQWGLLCTTAANYAEAVQADCLNDERVGRFYTDEADQVTIEVIHSE